MADEHHGGESIVWFLLGGLLGAGVALLVAPASGEETREKLGDWLKVAEKKGQRLLHEGREKLRRHGEEA